jgi:hypothetical protein
MPGGLLALACYGNQNVFVSGNPQFSYFHTVYKQHTHFAQEPIQIPLEGPNQLLMDAPILIKAKIPRQGDLLSDLTLRFTLPDVFSKAYVRQGVSGELLLDRKYEFAWVRQIGARLIDRITFLIGGQKVQEFNGDWIATRALLDLDNTTYSKWRVMVGDVPECFQPEQGIYADPSGQYPNVMAWRGAPGLETPVQNNSPSIPGRTIRVPLGLWFSDFIGNSLPLVALQYDECEIQIQIRPLRDLYTVLDPSGVRLRANTRLLPYEPTDQYTATWNPSLYGPLPESLNNLYETYTDLSGSMRYFLTDISGGIPAYDGWPLNATLEAIYGTVTDDERRTFALKPLKFNVRQMQQFIFSGVNTRAMYRLDVHNLATRIVYFARRSDALPYRNQHINLTNWINPLSQYRPLAYPVLGSIPQQVYVDGVLTPIGRTGINLPGLQRRIIRNVFITANGQPLFDSQDSAFFTEYTPYRYLKGYGAPFSDMGLASQSEMWPVHTYSFALNGSDAAQPSGSLNTSRVNRLEMDVDVEPIPTLARYSYDLYFYVETLNFLDIRNGLAGLTFAK